MTPDTENLEARIDRDKRNREAEIAFLLLGLYALSLRRIEDALRTGGDPYAMLTGVLFGNARLNMKGGTGRLARLMFDADIDGWRRTKRILPRETPGYAAQDYTSQAAQSLARNLATLQSAVGSALARSGGGLTNAVKAVREAYAKAGYVADPRFPKYTAWRSPSTAAELVGKSYRNGYGAGLASMVNLLTGFRFSATLDSKTTTICRAYHGVKVKPDDFWVRTHFPPCHFNCRSVILPIFGAFTPTADPPLSPQPMSGFGIAPISFAGFTFRQRPAA